MFAELMRLGSGLTNRRVYQMRGSMISARARRGIPVYLLTAS